jgi:ABC-type transport system involved in cytochrome bd biosynthesis fused ATPase/permease subunit
MEELSCDNIIEINHIKKLISHEKKLLKIFDDIIVIANIKLNKEKTCASLPIEENTEPLLSDHSSDED